MMSGWTGFSDDDLRKLKKSQNAPSHYEGESPISPKEVQLGKNKPKVRRFTIPANRTGENTSNSPRLPKLSSLKPENVVPVEQPVHQQRSKSASAERRNSLTKMVPKMPSLPEGGEHSETEDDQQTELNGVTTAECGEKDSSQAISEDLSKVERFQQQQKMMEELNRQKKKMLFQAINERQKQAAEETVKLKQIQQELSHLDNTLTADVSVMRDRIESVSIQFMEAQKKYSRIEKEFIAVKMELYRTADLKEQLTEHLYMMIHQNEMRKADKLSSLMHQLQLEDGGVGAIEMGVSDLPPLSAFSTYSVQTFPSPRGPGSPIQLINVPCFSSQTESVAPEQSNCDAKSDGDARDGESSVVVNDSPNSVLSGVNNGEDSVTTTSIDNSDKQLLGVVDIGTKDETTESESSGIVTTSSNSEVSGSSRSAEEDETKDGDVDEGATRSSRA